MARPDDIKPPSEDEVLLAPDKLAEQIHVSRRQPGLFYNGKTIPLDTEGEFTLGRDKKTCQVWIDDARVSRQHAQVFCRDGRFFIKDLKSLNGTFVNRERITSPLGLLPGDEIIVPPQKLLFVLQDTGGEPGKTDRPGAPTKTEPQRSHFAGLLHALRISDLIQLLNATFQSGVLQIQDRDRQMGRLYFVRGEIVEAQYKGKTGEDGVYALITIKDGNFEFMQQDVPMPANPIKSRTILLLLEGCKRADEAASPAPS
jgi:hypothetical protein